MGVKKPKTPATAKRRAGRKPRGTTDNELLSPAGFPQVLSDEFLSPENEPDLQPGEAGDRLRNAVDKQAALNSRRIARALVNKAINGDMNGTRMVVEITGAKDARNRTAKHPHPPILPWRAATLEAEPDWKGPSEAEEDKMYAETLTTA
ncbi:MAG: hypothetical protein WBQ94_08435 [Terracidiphilus sp.]